MEAFFISTGIVALAEIGDKTQLLAFILAAKYKRPWPIVWGILVATVLNHTVAAAVGTWITTLVPAEVLRWTLGIAFFAMAAWVMMPDHFEESELKVGTHSGVFAATLIAFFLAEIGDKTQIATVALAAQYHQLVPVVAGTTLGMMLANVPAVWLGEKLAHRIPVRLVHGIAALLFVALGAVICFGL